MIEQINNIETQLIHIIAERCNDPYFEDFHKDIYEEALYRADRKIARKYQILNRMLKFEAKIEIPPESANDSDYVAKQKNIDIRLDIPTFHQEYKVLVNDYPFTRGKQNALVDDSSTYYIYYGHNTWLFNYNARTEDDSIVIFYTSGATLDNFDADTNKPVIPDKFEDERIRLSLVEMANMGIAKFREQRKEKYIDILRLNNRKNNLDPNLVDSKAPITIQPFKYP